MKTSLEIKNGLKKTNFSNIGKAKPLPTAIFPMFAPRTFQNILEHFEHFSPVFRTF